MEQDLTKIKPRFLYDQMVHRGMEKLDDLSGRDANRLHYYLAQMRLVIHNDEEVFYRFAERVRSLIG